VLLVFLPSAHSTLYYYPTLFLTAKMRSLSTNNSLNTLYLSLIRSLYALFPLVVLVSFSPHSKWFMGTPDFAMLASILVASSLPDSCLVCAS